MNESDCSYLAGVLVEAVYEAWPTAQEIAYQLLADCRTDTYVELAAMLLDVVGLPASL